MPWYTHGMMPRTAIRHPLLGLQGVSAHAMALPNLPEWIPARRLNVGARSSVHTRVVSGIKSILLSTRIAFCLHRNCVTITAQERI